MVWFKDDAIVVRRRKPNRRRRKREQPLLMVSARTTDRRRARSQRVGGILLFTVALFGTAWALRAGVRFLGNKMFAESPQFTIRRLDLDSDGMLRERHIREYAGIAEGNNLFAIDIAQVRKELESVPIVKNVEVHRRLPDTLRVRLTERIAVARLGPDNRRHHLAIDREGYVLGPSSRRPDLPAVTGIGQSGLRPGSYIGESLVQDALTVIDICDTTRIGQVVKIASIDIRHPEHLDIRLANNEHVWLGRENLEWRLRQLARILQESSQMGRAIASADLTVDKNFPVKFRQPGT